MKNKFTLITIAFTLLFGFMACSDKDEDLTGGLIGKWTFVSYTFDDGTENHEHECSSKKDHVEFLSNGTFRTVSYDEDCSEEAETGTYSVNGDKLTIKQDDESSTSTFKLSGNELQILEKDGDGVMLLKKM